MCAAALYWDIIIVGAGNAGLCAAISARAAGASVLVLEKAPGFERGGDTAYTGGLFRFSYRSIDDLRPLLKQYSDADLAAIDVGEYPEHQYLADLDKTSEGLTNSELAETLVQESQPAMRWLEEHGIRWMLATGRQAHKVDGRFRFYGNLILEAYGGGQGLSDQLFARAQELGCDIRYGACAHRLSTDDAGRVIGVEVRWPGSATLACGAVVLASGGFQANTEWRARYLGPEWDLAKVRGTKYDTGDGIRMALEIGARSHGHWSGCHAVAWDLLAPDTGDRDMGDLFQKHSYPVGIVVNRDGQRFLDEGADFRNYTYAKYGREILRQPGRCAFQIFDRKTVPLLRDEYRVKGATKARADTIEDLAEAMLIDPQALRSTIERYNAAVQEGLFDPTVLDGKHARPEGQPPKSNWALRLDDPPFEAYAVTCGITFTFGGLKIDSDGRVHGEGGVIPGLFAAGELVGGLFYYNYPGGAGLMAGTVFGRRAGASAARAVRVTPLLTATG